MTTRWAVSTQCPHVTDRRTDSIVHGVVLLCWHAVIKCSKMGTVKMQVFTAISDYIAVTVTLTRAHECMHRCRSWADKWCRLAFWQHRHQLTVTQYTRQAAEYGQRVIRRQQTTIGQTPLQHLTQLYALISRDSKTHPAMFCFTWQHFPVTETSLITTTVSKQARK